MCFVSFCVQLIIPIKYVVFTAISANIGGLIGLFFGFSFISLAEFIFFAAIRPFRAARQAAVLKENVIIITAADSQRLGLNRKRYRRELGFNGNSEKKFKQLVTRKLYVSNEFFNNNNHHMTSI